MKKDDGKGQTGFDFDYWKKLAKHNPELFERKRREALDAVINSAPSRMQQRLRGLQWRVDMERERSKNPMSSCLRVYNMMWDSVYAKGGLLHSMDKLLSLKASDLEQPSVVKSEPKAKVLSFRSGQ